MPIDLIKEPVMSSLFNDVGLTCSVDIAELYEAYLSKNMSHLPKHFHDDINGFVKRNAIEVEAKQKKVQCICLMCLKAFIMDKGKKIGLSENSLEPLINSLKCNTGHNGFYFNNGDVEIVANNELF